MVASRRRTHPPVHARVGPRGGPARVYLAGGATALLHGWRGSTIDVDIKIVPDVDRLFRAMPKIKERLQLNDELASPDDFIPLRED